MIIFKPDNDSKSRIIKQFQTHHEVIIETIHLSADDENFLTDILGLILDEIAKENLFGYLRYCYKELLGNAKRANIKRIYFNEMKLDIHNENDYRQGMNAFKHELMNNYEHYTNMLSEKKYYVRTLYKIENDVFEFTVINNAVILDTELTSAQQKIHSAREFHTIEDAFSTIQQDHEGAGLGIIIMILMLRKIGLRKDNFNIYRTDNETITVLKIPLSLITIEQSQIINDFIIEEINSLPQFPDIIVKLQKKLENPEISVSEVTKLVTKDPGLIADILKLANSSIFMLPGRVSSIISAIKLIGIKRLKNVLYSYASKKLLNEKYKVGKMKDIWDHSYKVAFFAFHIAKNHLPKIYLEDIYIGALLHDIGRILLLGINSDLLNKIRIICQEKSIPLRIIEEITTGYNHALIGAAIAKKWNFPATFVYAIEYHNNPLNCNDNYKHLAYCIYFANFLAKDNLTKDRFHGISRTVMDYFKIKTFEQTTALKQTLDNLYKNTQTGTP